MPDDDQVKISKEDYQKLVEKGRMVDAMSAYEDALKLAKQNVSELSQKLEEAEFELEKCQDEYNKAAKQMGVHIPEKEEEIMETETRAGGDNTYRQQQRQYQRGARYQRGPRRNFKRNNVSEQAFTNVVTCNGDSVVP